MHTKEGSIKACVVYVVTDRVKQSDMTNRIYDNLHFHCKSKLNATCVLQPLIKATLPSHQNKCYVWCQSIIDTKV